MAVFNPEIQDEKDHTWFGFSKAITQPEFKATNVGAGANIKSIGTMVEGAIQGSDEVVKTFARDKVHAEVEPERADFTEALEAKDAAVRLQAMSTNVAPSPDTQPDTKGTPGASQSLVDTSDNKSVPPGVTRGLSAAGVVSSARASGKLSETDYYGRLMAIASDLRSQFPAGYRDYIDQQVEKITGVHPANAYIKSLLGDINSFVTAKNTQKEHMLNAATTISADGNPAGKDIYEFIQGGGSLVKAQGMIADAMSWKFKAERAKAVLAGGDAERTTIAKNLESVFNAEAAPLATRFQIQMHEKALQIPGVTFDEGGNIQFPDSVAVEQYKAAAVQYKNNLKDQLDAISKAGRDGPNGKYSFEQMGTAQQVAEAKQRHLDLIDYEIKWLGDEKTGPAHLAARLTQAQDRDANLEVYRTLPSLIQMKALDANSPEYAKKVYQYLESHKPEVEQSIKNYTDKLHLNAVSPNAPSVKEVADNIRRDGKPFPKVFPEYMKLYTGGSGMGLTDPETPPQVKEELAASLANPKNRGLIANMAEDKIMPDGTKRRGQYFMYRDITKPAVVDEMWKFAQSRPDIWINYRNGREADFQDLVSREVNTLKDVQGHKNLGLTWDSETHRWGLVVKGDDGKVIDDHAEMHQGAYRYSRPAGSLQPGQPPSVIDLDYLNTVRRSINNLNSALGGLTNVYTPAAKAQGPEATGTYIDSTLLKTMSTIGTIDYSKGDIKGIPAALMKTFTDSKKQQQEENKKTEGFYAQ